MRVYIDESGDEGFVFKAPPEKGSSDWFVLAAAIAPPTVDRALVDLAAGLRLEFGLPEKTTLHFADLGHEKRVRLAQVVASSGVRAAIVVVNKRAIAEPAAFRTRPFGLYLAATRLLVSKLSRLAAEIRPDREPAHFPLALIFEHKRSLSRNLLLHFMEELKGSPSSGRADREAIDWHHLDLHPVAVAQKKDYAGLQIADCIASGIRAALETNRHGNTEHRYAKHLRPCVLARYGISADYGLTFLPETVPDIHWIGKYYK